jgi:YtkA-like
MKFAFIKTIVPLLFIFLVVASFFSCSDQEIEVVPTAGMTKLSEGYALGAAAKVEVWAAKELFAGYNQVYFALYDSLTGKTITDSHIHIHPIMNMQTMSHSCPVEEPESEAVNKLFPAAVLFTMPSGDMGTWKLETKIHNHVNGLFGTASFDITVKSPRPSQVISFQASSGERLYLSYRFPEKQKVGINEFEVIAFTSTDGKFVPAENLTIKLTPEMPSMDHGSPNNEDPVHVDKGHYKGKANFTMTGEWRLQLELATESSVLEKKYFDIVVE